MQDDRIIESIIGILSRKFPHTAKAGSRHKIMPGVSLSKWAAKSGLSQVYLVRLFGQGKSSPSAETVRKLSVSSGVGMKNVLDLIRYCERKG